jgi:hypothetical protein
MSTIDAAHQKDRLGEAVLFVGCFIFQGNIRSC